MERHIDILEEYYEEIRRNSQLDIDPKEFAAKCVREYKERRRIEIEHECYIKNVEALEIQKKNISIQEDLMEFGESSSMEYLMNKGDRRIEALKELGRMVDRIRGD